MGQLSHEERLAGWVREHGRAVRGFLLGIVRREDVADDLKQEVFCRAWQARAAYSEQGSSLAYLLKIADRLVCDRYRRGEVERNLREEGWKHHEPHSPAPDVSQTAAIAEQVQRLSAALDRLSPIQRRVLLLRYYGQLSFAQIAEATECPLNTTLSHCHRALEALRKLLCGGHAVDED
jgi:RNA polymerase sigma-70 factor (ECF subfamily)